MQLKVLIYFHMGWFVVRSVQRVQRVEKLLTLGSPVPQLLVSYSLNCKKENSKLTKIHSFSYGMYFLYKYVNRKQMLRRLNFQSWTLKDTGLLKLFTPAVLIVLWSHDDVLQSFHNESLWREGGVQPIAFSMCGTWPMVPERGAVGYFSLIQRVAPHLLCCV